MKKKSSEPESIRVIGARQNNLKGLNLEIPLHKITVVTGPSGSGKSSLAFDTLYAEGQRRYVETFSPYARQFMDRMDRPQVDRIENIPPAIAIDRKDPVRTSRSSVGTMTEITDHVKLLFARAGVLHCRGCGKPVVPQTPAGVWKALEGLPEKTEVLITFPIRGGDDARKELLRTGFSRFLMDGRIQSLEEGELPGGRIDVVSDRLLFNPSDRKRVVDSIEQAFRFGGGRMDLRLGPEKTLSFSSSLECAECNLSFRPPLPSLFSFNSPIGACDTCRGFGRMIDIDLDLIVPDRSLSLEKGAIKPFGGKKEERMEYGDLKAFCRRKRIPMDVPFRDLRAEQQQAIIEGEHGYYGIRGFFKWLETKTYKMHVRVYLSRYRTTTPCTECGGSRFKPETLLYRLGGLNISEIYELPIHEADLFFRNLRSPAGDKASLLVLEEIRSRLRYLMAVGLGYLTLNRQSRTLSGGEVQRVALTSALGSSLVNTLYVLDEPSIGLHPRDSHRLISILEGLRDLKNTVVVVEHDPDIMAQSDFMLDLGPGAGEEGGRVMYFGPTREVQGSRTGEYLSGQRSIPFPKTRRIPRKGWLVVEGASEHNLREIEVKIPLGLFVCLTGVSGSGKSTLAEEILYRGIKRAKGDFQERPGAFRAIRGGDGFVDAILVDQRPIGRTPRGNPLTYLKAMDPIRRLLAGTDAARERGLEAKHFSFNVPGGRCETCQGAGFEKVEMQFLSDVFLTCPDCGGKRFQSEVLEVKYRGSSIHDILSMTVDQAMEFFREDAAVREGLKPLARVGLGYMRLGQPINTLSGGEAQRLKLSRFLKEEQTGPNLFIFDEPTTGLHFDDIGRLLAALQELVEQGNTVLVIEHNMDVVKNADWVIDMGPEGGDEGGRIVVAGPPEEVIGCRESHTAAFLKRALRGSAPLKTKRPSQVKAAPVEKLPPVIKVVGAREHNLKDLTLSIPRQQLVVVTGVSGSGKSTLIFDILFAEGQRRYLESLAPYVRQYVRILERPDVDSVSGLSPTVAIQQRISHAGPRSTVATLTEIYHFLRLLFSKLGKQHCPGCGRELEPLGIEEIQARIRKRGRQAEPLLLVRKVSGRKGFHKEVLARAHKEGFQEARIDGKIVPIEKGMSLSRFHEHTIDLVMGRFSRKNQTELLSSGLEKGDGTVILLDRDGQEELLSTRGTCPSCGISPPELDPRLFSFNSKQGACTVCAGLGRLAEGGDGRELLCPRCHGSRLRPEALSVKVHGFNLWELVRAPAKELQSTLKEFTFKPQERPVAGPVMAEIMGRLDLLNRLGLSYLSLGRSGETLSGGEAQRVRLAAQLGSNLTGISYILDEPTIGLHPRDNHVLLAALQELKARGNSILVVEHDEETIRGADCIIDLGPGAGRDGGRMVAMGTLADLKKNPASLTGASFDGHPRRITSQLREYKGRPTVRVRSASEHNLKHIDVGFPLGIFICVTGVSGSGKSTLLKETLFKGVRRRLSRHADGDGESEGLCKGIDGWKPIERILEVDHSPIGNTPRSVPASYVGFLSEIRKLLSMTQEARSRGYGPGRFSFNVSGGRCEPCKGHGFIKVAMSFLPDVYIRCEACEGKRFNRETLEITFKGKNISEILDLTFEEASHFFAAVPTIRRGVQVVCDIGLGYIRLGQSSPTLSGGEAQRIKLAEELAKKSGGRTFYVLDEPTTGLHIADVRKLTAALQRLVDQGNTVALIEHNLEVIKEADYIVDLGPEGGEEGGRVVATGSPAELVKSPGSSHTALHLKRYIENVPGD